MIRSDSLHVETIAPAQTDLFGEVATSEQSWPFRAPHPDDVMSHGEDQFSLICDNVQFDVAGRRSLLADLGKMIQSVLGLAAFSAHDPEEQINH